ncbi:hypothetical protein [Muricoccus radiodurans]|uniref:hypothetical protein n=1 Tax=Muricoccus radiodurans TaxID=2231721 RepID=UPI003CF820D8
MLAGMHNAAVALLVLSALAAGFAYWGLETAAGRQHFDEMAGIIPFAAALASVLLALLAALAAWLGRRRGRAGGAGAPPRTDLR